MPVAAPPGSAPLSVAQEALWYRGVLHPQDIIYNECVSFRHEGPLDVAALEQALEEIIRRHEVWRTTFARVDGAPVQVVQACPAIRLAELDLSGLPEAEAERTASRIMGDVARVPYDLRTGPLLRPRLLRFAGDRQRLYLAMHHIIFDGVSIYRTVLPELTVLYEAFAAGRPSPLPPPAVQYGQFAAWEQQQIDGPRFQRRLAWWQQQLADVPPLTLPTDRPRPEIPRFRGGVESWELAEPAVTRLRELAREHGATLFQALGAVWALVLSRLTGEEDVSFGTAADLRRRAQFESLVGYSLTPMVIRAEVSAQASFGELVTRVRNATLEGLDHVVPFERIVRELGTTSEAGENPIYRTLLVLEPLAADHGRSWSLHQMDQGVGDAIGAARLDLEFELDERPDGHLAGRMIFNTDLFERDTIVRIGSLVHRAVAAVSADPHQAVGRIALGDPTAPDVATVGVTTAGRETVADVITDHCRRDPDADAVSDRRETIDRAELGRRAEAVAGQLRAAGAGAGDRVQVTGPPSVWLVCALLGVLRAGGVPCGARAPGREDGPTIDVGNEVRLTFDGVPGSCSDAAGLAHDALPAGADPRCADLALALGAELGLTATTVVVVIADSLYGDTGSELWPALCAGAPVVLAQLDGDRPGAALSTLTRSTQATLLQASPQTWRALIDTGMRSGRSLRAFVTPAPADSELAAAILERCRVAFCAHSAPGLRGPVTFGRFEPGEPLTIGRPLPGCRVDVVDAAGAPAAVDVVGELVLARAGTEVRTGERARRLADGRAQLV